MFQCNDAGAAARYKCLQVGFGAQVRMTDIVLSLVVIAALALIVGAFVYWRRTGETKQPVLMLVLAAVAIANVLIWTIPNPDGSSPIDQVNEAGGQ